MNSDIPQSLKTSWETLQKSLRCFQQNCPQNCSAKGATAACTFENVVEPNYRDFMQKLQAQLTVWQNEANPELASKYADLIQLRNKIDASLKKLNAGFTTQTDSMQQYEWTHYSQQALGVLLIMTTAVMIVAFVRMK